MCHSRQMRIIQPPQKIKIHYQNDMSANYISVINIQNIAFLGRGKKYAKEEEYYLLAIFSSANN